MTLQPLPSEFPYIWGKFNFLFYQCTAWATHLRRLAPGRRRQPWGRASRLPSRRRRCWSCRPRSRWSCQRASGHQAGFLMIRNRHFEQQQAMNIFACFYLPWTILPILSESQFGTSLASILVSNTFRKPPLKAVSVSRLWHIHLAAFYCVTMQPMRGEHWRISTHDSKL